MSLPHAILGVLADRPRHGRAVARRLAHLLDGIRPVNPGQVYATLERLTRRHLLVAPPAAERGSHATRSRTYTLSPAGQAELQRWLGRAEVGPEPRCGFVERFAVLHALGDAGGLERLLASRRRRLAEMRAAVEHPLGAPESGCDADALHPYRVRIAALLREAALRLVAAELAWLDEVGGTLLDTGPDGTGDMERAQRLTPVA